MNVAPARVPPPVGPTRLPTRCTNSQAIASWLTKFGSVDDAITRPHTVLVSVESCHVTRTMPPSAGLGLKKWVVS